MLIMRTFKVWVLLASKPQNFTTAGDAWKIPLEPTVSNVLFNAIGFVLLVFPRARRFFCTSTTSLGFEIDYSSILTLDLRDRAGEWLSLL